MSDQERELIFDAAWAKGFVEAKAGGVSIPDEEQVGYRHLLETIERLEAAAQLPPRDRSQLNAAWAAGVMDAEGSITGDAIQLEFTSEELSRKRAEVAEELLQPGGGEGRGEDGQVRSRRASRRPRASTLRVCSWPTSMSRAIRATPR